MQKKNIYIMYAIALLHGMVFYGPVAVLYRQASGLTFFQIALIESISYLLCILLEIPWGIAADRIGYRKTMRICCGIYFLSKLVFWKANGFAGFMLERIMLSVVIAGMSGVDTSILYLSCKKGESQHVFGVYNSLSLAGLLSASLVFSAFVKDNYDMAAFLTVVSYGMAAVLSIFLTETDGAGKHSMRFADFRKILIRTIGNKRLILLLVSVAFVSQTHQTIAVYLNQIEYAGSGMSDSAIGYVYIGITLAGLSGAFSGRLTGKTGVWSTGVLLCSLAILACLMLGLTQKAVLSVCAVLLLNVTNSFFQPFQMELQNRHAESENRATELSVYAMIIDCVSAGTSMAFGALTRIKLEAAFLFGAGICSLALIFFILWYKRIKCHGWRNAEAS